MSTEIYRGEGPGGKVKQENYRTGFKQLQFSNNNIIYTMTNALPYGWYKVKYKINLVGTTYATQNAAGPNSNNNMYPRDMLLGLNSYTSTGNQNYYAYYVSTDRHHVYMRATQGNNINYLNESGEFYMFVSDTTYDNFALSSPGTNGSWAGVLNWSLDRMTDSSVLNQ